MTDAPYRTRTDGILVAVRLTPNSSRDEIGGLELRDGKLVLVARVRAVPEKGKANAALEKLIAKWLDVSKSSVRIFSGGKSRMKIVSVLGQIDRLVVDIEARLRTLRGNSK